ncbi:hypothetical protein [Cohnella nanjingensis]|uniref:Beta-carotene 15,15'-monooxygenase n=1 Tax=Cohnella nanjingensis TaxID=1387779 RepID=A0A7X0RLR5_9BACL|nr:hypothetical protein [Cohnella nanjingensis]MBB6669852.1 hypothetical protein [Cohnella nanjingensis]
MVWRNAASSRSILRFLIVAAFIVCSDTLIARWLPHASEDDRQLGYAILFDFMILIPLAYWFLVARKPQAKKSRVLLLPAAGAALAWFILPAAMRGTVWRTAWYVELLIIAVEAAVVFYEMRVIYLIVRSFLAARRTQPDTPEALRFAVERTAGQGKLASVWLHDMLMVYYLFFSWGSRSARAVSAAERSFAYHRNNHHAILLAIVTKILVFEAVAVHWMAAMWSPIAAWILTAASGWLIAWLWADYRASVLQPVRIEGDRIKLRYGLRIQADVPLDRIEAVEAVASETKIDPAVRRAAAEPIFGQANVCLVLRKPLRVSGMLFLPREVSYLYLTLDAPKEFEQAVRTVLEGENAV